MPGAVVVAVGAVLAALTLGTLGPLSVGLVGAEVILAGIAIRSARAPQARPLDRLRLVPLGLGILVIAVRGLTLPAAAAPPSDLPDGSGPWTAIVESVSAPRDGSRPAILAIESPPLRVAATLPWYPPVIPGDRVERTDHRGSRG